MNFNDFFSTDYCATRANSIIADNKQSIIGYSFGIAYEYMWDNIVNFDGEIYNWLNASSVEAYDAMDSAEKAVVTDMLHDWLELNYYFVPGGQDLPADSETQETTFAEQMIENKERALHYTREARAHYLGMKEQPRFDTNQGLEDFITETGFCPDKIWEYKVDGDILLVDRKARPDDGSPSLFDGDDTGVYM